MIALAGPGGSEVFGRAAKIQTVRIKALPAQGLVGVQFGEKWKFYLNLGNYADLQLEAQGFG